MACKSIQSSSSSQMICKHDVFVSFRGEDTRYNFTDHLFAALKREGIVTFRDDRNLKKGAPISPELLQAIEGSRVLIVVFSKNYAASTWCLRELAKIVDCIKVGGQSVLPVFCDVDPAEVRKQSGNYGKAFSEHVERFKEDLEMVQKWKEALARVANLSGWDVQDKPQHGEIENIVREVTKILGPKFSSLADDLVGMHSRVEHLENLLDLGSDDDVRVVGICGTGGIGKTTLATVVYDTVSHQYDACCFIDDVSKIYAENGPLGVQKQLLCQTLNEENLEICNRSKANSLIRTRLARMRAFIVLDNVDRVEQLEKLGVGPKCLSAGSRVILISRDKHILREYGVDEVYNLQLLNEDEALQLFCIKAFKGKAIMTQYEILTNEALQYAQGLPLAIKVLGSFLFDRDVSEWTSALARLRENPTKDIMDVLQISFDALEETEKEIFLDIACFFNRYYELTYVKDILYYCGFHPDIGIRVLIDKSLITISANDFIVIHSLLEKLGKKIVQEESPQEPGKWSRLWRHKDLQNVLANTATENIEAISLCSDSDAKGALVEAEAFSKMTRLRLLYLPDVNCSGSLIYLSNELRFLYWPAYPFTCLPSSFQPNKLVELRLPGSNIKQLWKGIQHLPDLTIMDLSGSKDLVKTPDFSGFTNLKKLDLGGCTKLVQINPSIGLLRKLVSLNLRNCKSLRSLPTNIVGLTSLESLDLFGCSNLFNNQLLQKARHAKHLRKPDIHETATQCQSKSCLYQALILPSHFFYSKRQKDSIGLLFHSQFDFSCLRYLNLAFCNLCQVPDVIGWLHCLELLDLGGNDFVSLPSSIKMLSKLGVLRLDNCKQLKSLPELPSTSSIVLPLEGSCYSSELYIFNCPKLADVEGCIGLAFSWTIRAFQVLREISPFLLFLDIVIPGSQIPRWFTNQSVGNLLSTEVDDNNWIGIVVCL